MSVAMTERPLECVAKLKALAEPTRLSTVYALMAGPSHVGELECELHVDQSLLSHHLRVLRDAGVVVAERDGKSVLYRLAMPVQVQAGRLCIDLGCCRLSFE